MTKKYNPPKSIRLMIIDWEGSSMRTNNSFESEALMFENYLREAGIYELMTEEELNPLFSLSYNIGSGNFNRRVVPKLVKLYKGNGSVEEVLKSMYGTLDPTLPGLRKRRKIEREMFKVAYNKRNKLRSYNYDILLYPDATRTESKPILDLQSLYDYIPKYNVMPELYIIPQNFLDRYINYWTQNIPDFPYKEINLKTISTNLDNNIFSHLNGGKLIKRGQYGMQVNHTGPYSVELYLEKDPLPEDHVEPKNVGKYGYIDIGPEMRMDLTVQQLSNGLSTYLPTKEQKLASEGIYHPKRITDWLGLAPVVLPAAIAAGVTLPEWGPVVLATTSNPAFWGEVIKDTGAYIAANAASQKLTGKDIGAHVNNAIGLEEDHPIGELLSFAGTSAIRKPLAKITKNGIRTLINRNNKVNLSNESLEITPEVTPENLTENLSPADIVSIKESNDYTTIFLNNGKIRLRLPSHTQLLPRELVLEKVAPLKYRVHVRVWNGPKQPGSLSATERKTLLDALYNELPDEAVIIPPESSYDNPVTRGAIAAIKYIQRDGRFGEAPGLGNGVKYYSKDGWPEFIWMDVLSKRIKPEELQQAAEQAIALGKLLSKDYIGSNNHILQIMNSGVSREYAEAIAQEMKNNLDLLSKITPEKHRSPLDGIMHFNVYADGTSDINIGVGWPSVVADKNAITGATIHELGGHGATLGTLDVNDPIKILMYKKQFPHLEEIASHNLELKPERLPLFLDESKISPEDLKRIKYFEDVDEYSARARAELIGSNPEYELNEYTEYFTPESVERLRKLIWTISPIGLMFNVFNKNNQ